MSLEIFKHAKEKGYYADENGNIFSKRKQISLYKDKITDKYFRYQFTIRFHGKRVVIQVHRYIGYLKYGDVIFNDDLDVRHLDGNSLNNKWDNIGIGTRTDNILDMPKIDRINKSIMASSKRRRFSDEEVKNILSDRQKGFKYKELCEKYNTSKSTLSYLFNKAYYTV